jgi:hypothetical protein
MSICLETLANRASWYAQGNEHLPFCLEHPRGGQMLRQMLMSIWHEHLPFIIYIIYLHIRKRQMLIFKRDEHLPLKREHLPVF